MGIAEIVDNLITFSLYLPLILVVLFLPVYLFYKYGNKLQVAFLVAVVALPLCDLFLEKIFQANHFNDVFKSIFHIWNSVLVPGCLILGTAFLLMGMIHSFKKSSGKTYYMWAITLYTSIIYFWILVNIFSVPIVEKWG